MPQSTQNQTVEQTVKLDLCLSCGICRAVCPHNAVTMTLHKAQFIPLIDTAACTLCGVCLRMCPGFDIFPETFRNRQIDNIVSQENCAAAYTVFSKDDKIRYEGTSGGFITHLLCLLLQDNLYDAAFVLPFDTFDGKQAMLQPVADTAIILASAGSKYVPASVENIISALRHNKNTRYIIVGTSCQIDGIKQYINEFKLSDSNLFFCGILCHRTFNYNAIRFYEDMFRDKKNERLTSIRFRTKEQLGWPGGTKLTFSSGKEKIVGQNIRKECKKYFQLNRCLFCFNKFNRQADIACGDCYVPEDKNPKGSSNILIRTQKGMDIFKKYQSYFVSEPADMELIKKSQDFLKEAVEHIEHAAIMADRLSIPTAIKLEPLRAAIARQRLAREQRLLHLGQRYVYLAIRFLVRFSTIAENDAIRWHLDTLKFALVFLTGMAARKKKPAPADRQNVIIVGGELFNKGAQAMTFSVVDYVKNHYPDKKLYLFSEIDYERTDSDKQKYNFDIVPWDFATKLRIANRMNRLFIFNGRYSLWEYRLRSILQNACCMIDISGFGLSSQFGDFKSFNYLLNFIVSSNHRIPIYLLPQSFGPFNYSRSRNYMLMALCKKWLPYPDKIFYRENDALEHLKQFKDIATEKSLDLILLSPSADPKRIYRIVPTFPEYTPQSGTVGIIPNMMLEKNIKRPALIALYEDIVKKILANGANVAILQHAEDDRWLCHKLRQSFASEPRVSAVTDELPSFELERIISRFDWIVGSRYHSIIYAYKHGIPAVVLGWAEKYAELMRAFGHTAYCFDSRSDISQILTGIDQMLATHKQVAKIIRENLEHILKTNNPLNFIRL
ncbi:MAG: polysaccharide pyruvyl transferase family protein [Candidatus Auribacterota bacterium]|jgi:coenzyme F420-reducing hydrogenase beta subunit/polysaccharide pyruvyl transferase WcaK-like protein|nr:polysaccharide pyruvyl transferase family protein [Candidatus Auribacterota bacterium]